MSKKILNVDDIERVRIINVISRETDNTEDILVEFPPEYEIDPISFKEVGLINVSPEIIGFNDPRRNVGQVLMTFYGDYRYRYID